MCNYRLLFSIEIYPVQRNKNSRILDSESEDDLENNNSNSTIKRRRIIENYLSSDDDDGVPCDFSTENEIQERNGDKYAQKLRKSYRNTGKKYYTAAGKIIREKIFQHKDCHCLKNCINLINVEERKNIFDNFWNLGNFNKQNVYLHGATEQHIVQRKRLRNGKGSPRNYTYKYYLKSTHGNVSVCKKFFLSTFNISAGRLQRILKCKNIGNDLRGRMPGSSRKIHEEDREAVTNHIKSFPQYESHYTRSHNPRRRYLHPELNVTKMFNLYLEECKQKNLSNVNEWTYRKIFKNEYNLHFHQPQKDTCQKCDQLNIKIKASCNTEEKENLTEEHNIHLRCAELARKSLKEDKDLARNNPNVYFAFSFDLEKALPFPKLSVSIAYYKRNMYIYNLGCHNFHDNEVYMYAWDETVASRGSQEVGSCILKHLKKLRNHKHIIAYSDMCTGQNRNIKLALTWLKIVQSAENNADIIDHKFLLSGHSFLPNDSDFGVIEMALRKNNLMYVPQDYYETIKKCRKSNKFILTKMKREDFFSTKPLEEAIHKRLKNTSGEPVNWLRICWMRFIKSEPYKMFYKESMEVDKEFKILDLLPCRGRPRNFNKIKLTPLYKNVRPISTPKYKDMMELLRYIPPMHHEYFNNLTHNLNEEK